MHGRTGRRLVVVAVVSLSPLLSGVAAAQPLLGQDRTTDGPRFTPALLDQDKATIAYGGGVYFAAWWDGDNNNRTTATLRASRLDANGKPMDRLALARDEADLD